MSSTDFFFLLLVLDLCVLFLPVVVVVVVVAVVVVVVVVDTRYICRSMETPGQISWEYDVDPQMLLHQNQNVAGLKRNSNLIHKTPLMLGRGTSSFVTREKAENIFATIGTIAATVASTAVATAGIVATTATTAVVPYS